MPDVRVDNGITLDMLDQQKPGTSVTSDMPVVETHPDASPKPKPEAAPEKAETVESATTEEPESVSASAEPEKKPAKGVQKRIDELTRQREDERRARLASDEKLERTLAMLEKAMAGKPAQESASSDDPEPQEPDAAKYTDQAVYNADYRQYLKDLAKREGKLAARETQKAEREQEQKRRQEEGRRKAVESYSANVAKAREKYPDYDAVVYSDNVPFTNVMSDAIVESAQGPEIAYHLAQNPEEVVRISRLSPRGQLMELGTIAAELKRASAAPVVKPQVSQAPKPITPISSGTNAASTRDEESMEAYAARRAKELSKERVPGGVRR